MDGLTLVVMAAGVGSRYGGLKQVEPIGPNGEWIVDYSVFDAVRSGFERVVFVVRDEIEIGFRERFERTLGNVCRVDYVVQSLDDLPAGFSPPPGRSKPWGTGHAVWSCRGVIDGPFGVINADDFYGLGAFELLAGFLARADRDAVDHVLIGYELSKTLTEHGPVTRGVCRVDDDGLLLEIVERHRVAERTGAVTSSEDGETWIELPPDTTVSMNMWGFDGGVLAELSRRLPMFLAGPSGEPDRGEFLLPEVVGALIAHRMARVRVLATDEAWFGVTFREDVRRARQAMAKRIESGRYPAHLWSA
jgi:NDP-sugar pyrophosphorylase family protein